jgi:UDP-3-O-[3-hydroxymyristoyl] N-acetylglucosamine deacetylase
LLAALWGLEVDNARIEVEGPEMPIMDGSAAPFAKKILEAGRRTLPYPRSYLLVERPVELRDDHQYVRVTPGKPSISCAIDFPHPLIQRQRYTVRLNPETFWREIAPARTFGFLKEVEYLHSRGLALGGSLDNAVVLDDGGVLNPDGLRFPDEFVRHKILDALGDLALLGLPLVGRLEVSRGSHALHHRFLEHLVRQKSAWRFWTPANQDRTLNHTWDSHLLWEAAPA